MIKKRIHDFYVPVEAYDMLMDFVEQANCSIADACELAIFHLLGSLEHDKQLCRLEEEQRQNGGFYVEEFVGTD